MSTSTPAKYCDKCKTTMVSKRIQTKVPNTQPVDLALCRCDYGTCRAYHADLPWYAKRCPSCDTSA